MTHTQSPCDLLVKAIPLPHAALSRICVVFCHCADAYVLLSSVVSEPCEYYKSNSNAKLQAGTTGAECISKVWKELGCTTPNTANAWALDQTYQTIWNDAAAWATLTSEAHRTGCYGSDRSKWPAGERFALRHFEILKHWRVAPPAGG